MSKLDEQLKELKAKKLKTEFFKLIKDNLNKIDSKEFKDVAKEVKDEVNAFIDSQIDMIETGEISHKNQIEGLFSEDQVKILKALSDRAMSKQTLNKPAPVEETHEKIPDKPDLPKPDKIQFALKHRHLGNKKVQVRDRGNGTCVGIDAPHIIVKLDSGVTIHTMPEEIIV
tara:strand:+ start:89045 stop:89557 length:513 start_codon:yes stop_codon:yes gene_type:complete